MLRTGVVITDGNNLHAKPGGKKVVDQLAKDDRLWVLEEIQHRKKWLMVQPWRQGAGLRDRRCSADRQCHQSRRGGKFAASGP